MDGCGCCICASELKRGRNAEMDAPVPRYEGRLLHTWSYLGGSWVGSDEARTGNRQ